jgi:hypothetical protein
MVNLLEMIFPELALGGYSVTSARSRRYNCIAWAAGDSDKWWWPGPNLEEEYWPATVERVETLNAFRAVFVSLGYTDCEGDELEPGFEKIALFATDKKAPTHGARQLLGGRWTSKIGYLEDIEHDLRDLEGTAYGMVVLVMKRPIENASSDSEN